MRALGPSAKIAYALASDIWGKIAMRRRQFIMLAGGAAATWPLGADAQQSERKRRVGVLMGLAADDAEAQDRIAAFEQGLQQSGWTKGHNLQIDYRRGAGDTNSTRRYADELVALAPDVILASGGTVVGALLQATRTVPIVFTQTPDPVAAGFVASLARPGGNATGFTTAEYGTSGKWLELLKEIAPSVTQAAVLRDPSIPAGIGQFASIQSVAPSFGVELSPVDVRDASEIERDVTAFARGSNRGLIVTSSGLAAVHRQLIIKLAARYRLPAIYSYRYFATSGGLISYGPDPIDQYRRAAGYVDRILKGEKAADLPVQAPTKYELAINLKAAKVLGLTVPPTLISRADEVIE
jgi:putative tryptophan/tyrosine transport system substrate-binding protein